MQRPQTEGPTVGHNVDHGVRLAGLLWPLPSRSHGVLPSAKVPADRCSAHFPSEADPDVKLASLYTVPLRKKIQRPRESAARVKLGPRAPPLRCLVAEQARPTERASTEKGQRIRRQRAARNQWNRGSGCATAHGHAMESLPGAAPAWARARDRSCLAARRIHTR